MFGLLAESLVDQLNRWHFEAGGSSRRSCGALIVDDRSSSGSPGSKAERRIGDVIGREVCSAQPMPVVIAVSGTPSAAEALELAHCASVDTCPSPSQYPTFKRRLKSSFRSATLCVEDALPGVEKL